MEDSPTLIHACLNEIKKVKNENVSGAFAKIVFWRMRKLRRASGGHKGRVIRLVRLCG